MKCSICGAVKNCGPYLNKVFKNIEKIGSLFNDYRVIIYYDDSIDDTLEKLNDYKKSNDKISFYVNKDFISQYRTVRIERARNFCLQQIRDNYLDYEFFIMMDFDDVCSSDIKLEILEKYLKREDWDGLSFNKCPYYDLWALSIKPYFLSCLHFGGTSGEILNNYITNLFQNLPPGELLPCASAFNGFAIYKTNKFINCNYFGKFNFKLFPQKLVLKNLSMLEEKINFNFVEDCEHRAFHIQAINKNNARIRISPEILFN